ncbi:glycosyl hydrolase 115 family protein [Alteromonas lipolytica]|uniref:Gylcosyl hydrolase 115 C-terminal domain-containing protein n=1 Tax=Alteromonas lipolytica TaxID=1856405 RepID=A0A1E8FJ01_9ALTE|nr:glycosyl hydrolase 115 family protein [Alteromonas lipolytica]OFI35894.1 hypothetical protein BFC17_10555 [Alteromonas lipolytica]
MMNQRVRRAGVALLTGLMAMVSATACAKSFVLASFDNVVGVVVSPDDAKVVSKAADMLRSDIAAVSGNTPYADDSHGGPAIYAGTLSQSPLIKQLTEQYQLDVSGLREGWEQYQYFVIDDNKAKPRLVIVGSDRRGTAYGLLAISRKMGVSPWEWWADVTPEKQFPLQVDINDTLSSAPSVKYRGIFINDEDWGLQIWAAKNYEPEVGDMGPKTYARVFELLLRLRANLLWPAMHKSTIPFYQIPENKQVADDYGIVIGTSHAEPMLSNINGEWDKDKMGQYRFDTNAGAVTDFFRNRVKETASFENIYTVAMRGEHDSPMIVKDSGMDEQVELLENVINTQRQLLTDNLGKPASTVPQVFVPYKEVLTYYQNGLEVPDDITLMWTDDNYGYLRQLSNPQEQQRAGGAGIYYHTSYWGRPHDYLWLNSTNPVLMWEEITKAWEQGAREQWVLNVGDIKPHEYNTELFMDIAWNRKKFSEDEAVFRAISDYFARDLGEKNAAQLNDIFRTYYQLVFKRRPEFMAWNHVEPVTLPGETTLTQTHYGDEVSRWADAWEDLISQIKALHANVPEAQKDAFFELAYYPVVAAGNMNLKWLYYYKNRYAAAQGRGDAKWYAKKMRQAYAEIIRTTDYFNNELASGKWQHVMSASPRELPVFQLPPATAANLRDEAVSLVVEGFDVPLNHIINNSHADSLPVINAFTRKPRFIDIVLNSDKQQSWSLSSDEGWIKLSASSGTLTPENPVQRVWVSADWDAVPKGIDSKEPPLGHDFQLIPPSFKVTASLEFTAGKASHQIGVSVFNPDLHVLSDFDGFVEDLGYVSIAAERFQRSSGSDAATWKVLSGVGYSGGVIQPLPVTAESVEAADDLVSQSPSVEYDFYTFNRGSASLQLALVPTHAQYKGRGSRIAVRVDNGPVEFLDFATQGRSETWKNNVLMNRAIAETQTEITSSGKHTLKVWMVDSGVMLDEILIDLGGRKQSYGFPASTYNEALSR